MPWVPAYGCAQSGNGNDDAPIAVITGASGAVGHALARQLSLDLPHHRLLLLSRRPAQLRSPLASAAFADIRQPDLGLDPGIQRLLQERAELLVHAAADIRFNLPLEESRHTNATGTRHVLETAQRCRRLRHFAHISTLYVAGGREGRVSEQPLHHDAGYVNSYEASKHEAEEVVLAHSTKLPVGIYRLSSVIDISANNGHVRKVLRLAAWAGRFRYFPGAAHVPVDIISSDWVARALSALLTEHAEPGCVRHLCAGASGALSLADILNQTLSAYESFTGKPRPSIELVSLAEFTRLRQGLNPDDTVMRAFDSLMTFLPHLSIPQPFENKTTSGLLRRSGVEPADVNSVLTALIKQELKQPKAAINEISCGKNE